MFDFPASPTNGQTYTPSGGPTYVYRTASTAWEVQASPEYVLKAGDTMTGDLVVTKTVYVGGAFPGVTPTAMRDSTLRAGMVSCSYMFLNAYQDTSFAERAATAGWTGSYVFDAPTGAHSWGVSTASVAAGATVTGSQKLLLDKTGNLTASNAVFSLSGSFVSPTTLLELAATGAGLVAFRPNGAGVATNQAYIDTAGNLTIGGPTGQKTTGTTWANPSDARIKDDVQDYTVGLDSIVQLRPVTFKFKADTEYDEKVLEQRQYGLIAQEAEQVMPSIVTTAKGGVGKLQFDDFRSLDASNIIWALINAVRTLKEQNDEQAARIAALEAGGA